MKLKYKIFSGVIVASLLYILYTKHKQYKSHKETSNKKDSSTQTDIIIARDEDLQTDYLDVQVSDAQTTFLNTVIEETGSQMNLVELDPDTTNSDYSTNSPTTEDLIHEVQQLNTVETISPVDYSDIEEMTMAELKEYCKIHGIKGTSRMKKLEIIDYIKKLE